MSNLGPYQTFTTFAKKVGGPIKLELIISTTSCALGITGTLATQKLVLKHKNKKVSIKDTQKQVYSVFAKGESNEGVKFNVGDKFRAYGSDGDAILIEKIGDHNNPYYVSKALLNEISNYN